MDRQDEAAGGVASGKPRVHMGRRKRRKFSDEYKQEAVRLSYYALFFKDLEGIKYEIVCTKHDCVH